MYTRLPPVGKRLKRSSDTELPLPTAPIRVENGLKSTQYSDGRLAQPVRAPALQIYGLVSALCQAVSVIAILIILKPLQSVHRVSTMPN
jgi:hypothetical protein